MIIGANNGNNQNNMNNNNFTSVNEQAANSSYLAEYYSAYTGPGVNFVNNLSLSLICLFLCLAFGLDLSLFYNKFPFELLHILLLLRSFR